MKKNRIILFILCLALFFASCKERIEVAPDGGFSIYEKNDFELNEIDLSKATDLAVTKKLKVGEPIMFVANSDAQTYTVWPGESGNNYNGRNLSETVVTDTSNNVSLKKKGYALEKRNDKYVYTYGGYSAPGEYTVVFVSRSLYENSEVIKETIDSITVVVEDFNTDITGTNTSDYKFKVVTPVGCSLPVFEGDNVYITAPIGANLNNAKITIKCKNAIVSFDQKVSLTKNPETGLYTWIGNLSTTEDRVITLTSLNGATKDYFVKVTYALPSVLCDLSAFSVGGFVGAISTNSVNIEVPTELDLSDIAATFTASAGAKVYIGTTEQTSATTKNNLSSGATYIVKAADATNTKSYTVSFTKIPTILSAFSFAGLNPVRTATIDDVNETIAISVINGTDLTSIIPTFTNSSIAKLKINGVEVTSGVTEVDLSSSPITVEVEASSTIKKTYTLTVTTL